MDDQWKIKTVLGESQASIAEAWFKYLGFLTLTAVVHAVAEKSGLAGFVAMKWICYLAIWRWVMYKVDSFIWVVLPSVKPSAGKRVYGKAFFAAIAISTTIAGMSYFISIQAISVIKGLGT